MPKFTVRIKCKASLCFISCPSCFVLLLLRCRKVCLFGVLRQYFCGVLVNIGILIRNV
ncbi:hypothetical protein IscW_ISCW001648 [Ixodes scapularis]|uniref:Uncharacterized protein n=1 Tax=Ixodes scapularis TaxID=6945 RepID=B7P7C5_IXOSC|nr:hypothetical protein IscW_ISCW001648 [Ixodes scapularis]|eukprot:XP_002410014.1 hypothetical protein IscW_ISCW001648 [Ixodes scapularis]